MNKKIFSLILLIPLLGACSSDTTSLEFEEYQYLDNALTTFKEEKGDVYYRNDKVTPLNIEHFDGVNITTNVYQVNNLNDISTGFESGAYSLLSNDVNNPNEVIEQNLLVVPVYFTDSSVATSDSLKNEKKILLENAFFGRESKTNYQSVASYYNRSSYGHLRLKGEVLDWVSISQTSEQAYNEGNNRPENYSDKIVKQIVDGLDSEVFNKYSSNHDGVIDALYVVYDYPYQKDKKNNEDSLFWAYTYHCKSTSKASAYSWSSFDFIGGNALKNHVVDATTFIHETGHLFGLLDYYNKGSFPYQPLGFMDMMDYNLGDHSPLSKYLMNWASPYILDMGDNDKGSITIQDFSSTGDFILVPTSTYNGTAYDRYLLISFFTPKGLNDLENFPSYEYTDLDGKKNIFTYPNKYGVLVYEVNAKLGFYKSSGVRSYTPTCDVSTNPGSGNYVINFYYDNELTSSSDKPLYRLLENNGENTFITGKSASNETLFKFGSTFGIDSYQELALEFGVSFKVTELNKNHTKITFTKLS